MKNLLITASIISTLALSSPTVFAGNKHNKHKRSFDDTARVTHVEPLYTTVRVATPQRECSQRPYRHNSHNSHNQKSYTTTIAGSVIGGVVGNQFGGGSGKKIMTVAGALLGGSVGRDLGYQSQSYSNYDRGEECHVTQRYHQEERIDGYLVTYRYQGQSYTTEMDRHPGKYIPVEVSVRPRGYSY